MPIPNEAAASFPAQAEPDSVDFDIVTAAANAYGVVSGCACTPASSGVTLGVAVASGSVHVGSSTPVAVTGATVTPGAAHATNPRFDLITANTSGTLAVVAGTAAAAPVFPAIPASRVVLAAVYIPATATSITAANLVDKRQMVNRTPQFGTVAGTAAEGDHLHSGQYASTAHATTHRGDGSDPIIELGGFELYDDAGDGFIALQSQLIAEPTAWPADDHIQIWAAWLGYRPVPVVQSIDRFIPFGDEVTGPSMVWRVHPGTATTAPIGATEVPSTNTASTWSTPTATTALGYRQSMNTSNVSANAAFVSTTDLRYVRGDSTQPWCGYYFHARIVTDHANGYTTSRIFVGLTDQTASTALGATDPAGHRHGFKIINGTGNWLMTVKNGTTEATLDSGVAFATSSVFDFYVYVRPNGGYPFGHVINRSSGANSGSLIDISGAGSIPGGTTFMRAMAGIATTSAAIRGMSFHRVGCEVAV